MSVLTEVCSLLQQRVVIAEELVSGPEFQEGSSEVRPAKVPPTQESSVQTEPAAEEIELFYVDEAYMEYQGILLADATCSPLTLPRSGKSRDL